MKQPILMYENTEYEVLSAAWHKGGKLAHVSFHDANGEFKVAHQTMSGEAEGVDGFGNLNLDLHKRLWR